MTPSTTQDDRARYFFTVRCGGRVFPDRTGVDLPDSADLQACARFLADCLRADDTITAGLSGGWRVEVRDANGVLVRTVLVPETGA